MNPLEKRMCALEDLRVIERPTTKAKAYSEWLNKPEVHLETTEAEIFYQKLFKEIWFKLR